jgi:hypothetical protein
MPKQMGEITVDHRASPGLPEDVAIWAGYDPKQCGEGKVFVQDILHCSHCDCIVVKNNARTRERALCMECDNRTGHYICDSCDYIRKQPGYVHFPYRKYIDDYLHVAGNPCLTGVPFPTLPHELLVPKPKEP